MLLLLLASAVGAGAASAQGTTTFNPAISFGYFITEDVDLTGETDQSDSGFRLGIELPVVRQLPNGSISFSYRPQFEQFDKFKELDNTSHQANFNVDLQKRFSTISFRLGYTKGISPGRAESPEDPDLFVSQRLDRELGVAGFSYSNKLVGRWRWTLSGSYATASYQEIMGFETGNAGGGGVPGTGFEDRTSFGGSLGLSYEISRRTQFGVTYGRSEYELDLSGNATTDSASFVISRQLSRQASFSASLGAFRTEGVASRRPQGDPNDSRSGVQGSLSYNLTVKNTQMVWAASLLPSAGGTRAGTSTNGYLLFSVTSSTSKRWSWSGAARYARREASDEATMVLESFSVSIGIERQLFKRAGVRLGANYIDQTGQDERLQLLSGGGISFVWYPLSKLKISGRSE